MSITYCSTEHMLAYFTKSLQVLLFVNFCEVIMGWKHIDTPHMETPSANESVGNMDEVKYIK